MSIIISSDTQKSLNQNGKITAASLVNPDAPQQKQFPDTQENQEVLLSLLIQDESFASNIRDKIEPNYFADKAHARIWRHCQKHKKDHGILPTRAILENYLTGDDPTSDYRLAQLDIVMDCAEPHLCDTAYYEANLRHFIYKQEFRINTAKAIDLIKAGQMDEAEQGLKEVFALRLKNENLQDSMCDLAWLKEQGEKEFYPCLYDWLPLGEMGILAAPPLTGGKTFFCAQQVAKYLTGGNNINADGVLWIDLDGRQEQIGRTLNKLIGGQITTNKLVYISKNHPAFPDSFNVERVKEAINTCRQTKGWKSIFVILDPLRHLLTESNTDDLDPNALRKIADELQQTAHRDKQAAILVLHHATKGKHSDPTHDIKGDSALVSALDTAITIENNEDKTLAKYGDLKRLFIVPRLSPPQSLYYRTDTPTGFWELLGTDKDMATMKDQIKDQQADLIYEVLQTPKTRNQAYQEYCTLSESLLQTPMAEKTFANQLTRRKELGYLSSFIKDGDNKNTYWQCSAYEEVNNHLPE